MASRFPKPQDLHRIALLCYGGLGDVLLFTPVISELRAWLPHCHISLFVEDRSLAVAELLGDVASVHAIPVASMGRRELFFYLAKELKTRHYDAVLSTGGSPYIGPMLKHSGIRYRVGYDAAWWSGLFLSNMAPLDKEARSQYASVMHFGLARAFLEPLLGKMYTPKTEAVPVITGVPEDAFDAVKPLLFEQTVGAIAKKHILIHPGVSQAGLRKGINKTWAPSAWAELILQASRNHYVYLAGGPDDEASIIAIEAALPTRLEHFKSLYGQTRRFAELAALMQLMDAVVCVDSAPLHLAVALHKPTLALFGPTDEKKLTPPGIDWVKTVSRNDLSCRPCLWDVRSTNCQESTCLQVEPAAMAKGLEQLLSIDLSWQEQPGLKSRATVIPNA